jgi:hypothetical protein
MTERAASSSFFVLFLLLLVLAQGAYVGIGLYLTPTVANIVPNPARAGSAITIHGTNFAADAWDNAVLFGNQSGKVTKTTSSTIEVELPPPAGSGALATRAVVRVVVGGRVSVPFEIAIVPSVAAAPSPVPTPFPPPTTVPTPEPSSPPPPTPSPTPRPAPTATPASPRVAELLAEAATAESARRYDDAIALYEKALAAEPGNAKAQAAHKAAQGAASSLRRTFHPGKTVVEGPTVARGNFKEFDTREVAMRKAPEVPGSIVFDFSPGRLLAGDPYAVKIYLQNEGAKAIRISSMRVTVTVNGNAATTVVPARPGEIAAKGRALVHEAPGVWKEGTTAWTLDVQISSAKGDTYRNQADWK